MVDEGGYVDVEEPFPDGRTCDKFRALLRVHRDRILECYGEIVSGVGGDHPVQIIDLWEAREL